MTVQHNRNFYFHLLVQGLLAMVFMFLLLFFLDLVRAGTLIWAAGASTLASTAFMVFGTPNADSAKPHRIIIGYAIAIFCGHFIRLMANYFCSGSSFCHIPEYVMHVHEVAAILSLALAFFLMVMLRSSHPPAAGLAVVMVLDISNLKAMIVIGVAAVILTVVMLLFRKSLKPLI